MSMDQDKDEAHKRLDELVKCKAVEKLKAGKLHEITYENTQQLLEILDQSESGELAAEELRVLKGIKDLNLSDDDIDQLIADCDKDGSGKLNVEELHVALQQGSLNYKIVLEALGQGAKRREHDQCNRDELLEFLKFEHETNDALCSLPITLLSFFLFFVLVTIHLQVHTAYGMQSAIQGEVEGEGKPYLGTYVHDVPTFWTWMQQSYVGAQFKSSQDKLKQYPYPGRFAVYNQIIGGTQVVKTFSSQNTTCDQSGPLPKIYDSSGGRCHKTGPEDSTSEFFLYHEDVSELVSHIQYLDQIDWVTQDTRQLDFTNVYYNANLGLFTDFHLTFDWQGDGFVKIVFGMESYAADPYSNWWYIVIDVLYMLILTRMLYQELSEMLPRLLNGLDGFLQYWEFWNVVDWLNIVLGTVSFVVWGLICSKVSTELQEAITALPTKQLDEWVTANQTYFTTDQLEDLISIPAYQDQIKNVHTISASIASMHKDLRTITFFYSFTLMLKFFKAFQANPRLNIVVMTMSDSAVDIVHFAIVFTTIFFVFSLMAHVVFGSKMLEYHTQVRAVFMTWRVLLGDFELEEMELVDFLLANVWFFVFQVLVMMILLNMLLAIIMDTYSGVVGKGGKKTIWDQTREAVTTVRETRGHLPLLYIRCEMEDEDQKAHPGEQVTTKSLRKAFERDKMSRANAEYLIRKTNEYLKEKEEKCELQMHDAIRLVGQTKTMVMKINDTAEQTLGILKKAEKAPMEARQEAIMAGIDPDTNPHWQEQMMKGPIQKDKIAQNTPMITNGAPTNNNMYSNSPYSSPGYGGYAGAPLMINVVQDGHPFAVNEESNQQTQPTQPMGGQGAPFAPSNANNTRSYGTPTPNPLYNPTGTQGMMAQNFNNGFGNTGMTSTMPSVTNVSVNMAYSQQAGATTITPQMAGGGGTGGGGASGVQMQELIDRISRLEQNNAANFGDLKTFIEQRDAWMMERMTQVDRRCQKVEVLSDRLYTLLRDIDVQKLSEVPMEVRQALSSQRDGPSNRRQAGQAEEERHGVYMDGDNLIFDTSDNDRFVLRDASDMPDNPRMPETLDRERDSSHSVLGTSPHRIGVNSHRVEERLNNIADQLEHLLSLAEETPKMTSMLWRMDLNLRQLTGTAHNLPANHPLLQAQVQPQAQPANESHSPSRRSSRQASAMRGTTSIQGSAQNSRIGTKASFLPVPEGQG